MKNLKEFNIEELDSEDLKKIDGGILFTIVMAIGVGIAFHGLYNYVNK